MNVKELRNATAAERENVIIPGLLSMKKQIKTLKHQNILTLIAGLMTITVIAAFCFFYLNLSTMQCFLALLPFVAVFTFSSFRAESRINILDYMFQSIRAGEFLVKEIRTEFEDTYALCTYVRHPKTSRLAMLAFAGAELNEGSDPYGKKRAALERVCNAQRRGHIVELEFPEGGAY